MYMSKPKTLDQAFELITKELLDTFLKKHRDYGKGNILSIKEIGIAFRITEKTERLKHLLMSGKTPDNESVKDSWTDIAVYAVIARLYQEGWFQDLEVREKSTD